MHCSTRCSKAEAGVDLFHPISKLFKQLKFHLWGVIIGGILLGPPNPQAHHARLNLQNIKNTTVRSRVICDENSNFVTSQSSSHSGRGSSLTKQGSLSSRTYWRSVFSKLQPNIVQSLRSNTAFWSIWWGQNEGINLMESFNSPSVQTQYRQLHWKLRSYPRREASISRRAG